MAGREQSKLLMIAPRLYMLFLQGRVIRHIVASSLVRHSSSSRGEGRIEMPGWPAR